MGILMQKIKQFIMAKPLSELTSLVGRKNILYKCNKLTAYVPIRKESGSAKYVIKIVIYKTGKFQAFIVKPKIKKCKGQNPPHIYKSNSKWNAIKQEYDELCLCLYLPDSGEYNTKDKLIENIISWAIKWTEFYEIWLLTGKWYGGGVHPKISK